MMGWLFAILLIAVITWLVVRVFKSTSQPPKTTAAPPLSKTAAADRGVVALLGHLLKLNLEMRDQRLGGQVLKLAEQVIDQLRSLLPRLNAEHQGQDLTWTVNQLASHYLPEKTIRPYLKLSATNRTAQEESVLASLKQLHQQLVRVATLVDTRAVGEFERAAAFIKERFPSN